MSWNTHTGGVRGIPSAPGVYALYFDGKFSYVGSSNNLNRRLSGHGMSWRDGKIVTKWGVFESLVVKYRVILKCGDWLRREHCLILRLRPPLNLRLVRPCNGKARPTFDNLYRTVHCPRVGGTTTPTLGRGWVPTRRLLR